LKHTLSWQRLFQLWKNGGSFSRQQLLVGYYELEQYPERLERELEQRQHEQQ
jgi:hypothetical protein